MRTMARLKSFHTFYFLLIHGRQRTDFSKKKCRYGWATKKIQKFESSKTASDAYLKGSQRSKNVLFI